jgi:hypothetical protein
MFNETLYHPEVATFRAVTGGAYNLKGAYGVMVKGSAFPVKGAIPIPTGKSGTIISTGKKVRGTDTLFTREMKEGDHIYAKDVVRRIDYIVSDTLLVLTQEFPTDILTGVIPLICEQQFYKAIVAKNVHTSDAAILQEAPIASGQVVLNGGAPLSYDATSGQIDFTLNK